MACWTERKIFLRHYNQVLTIYEVENRVKWRHGSFSTSIQLIWLANGFEIEYNNLNTSIISQIIKNNEWILKFSFGNTEFSETFEDQRKKTKR